MSSRLPPGALLVLSLFLAPSLSAQNFSSRFETIKKEATPDELYHFLYDLPKGGDLHNHMGGSAFAELWLELARDRARNGNQDFYTRTNLKECATECDAPLLFHHNIRASTWETLPPCCKQEYKRLTQLDEEEAAAWRASLVLDRAGEGRDEFFEKIWARLDQLIDEGAVLAEIMAENMKLFADEKVRYIEWQISPFRRYRGEADLSADAFHELLMKRLQQPDAQATGVTVRFQTNVLRFHPDAEQHVIDAFEFVDRHRDFWVSINLVGREDNDKGYPLRFLDTFRAMRRRYGGIGLAIHGGEVDEPNQHVRDTLLLGAERIGHGTNLVTDPDTLLLMRTGRFLVEVSLVSNRLLDYYPDVTMHPFPEYLRLGIPVALATDDRGMWDSNMTDEYMTAVLSFNLTWEEVVRLGRDSLRFAFVEPSVKKQLLESYQRDIADFESRYDGNDWRELTAGVSPKISGYAKKTFFNQAP